MKAVKYSRQRESIKEYLKSRTDHPTADMIYAAVRQIYPNISLGTVYRNLTLLTEQGEIQKISCGEGSDRFDARMDKHYHFICRRCGSVMDLPSMDMNHIDILAGNGFDGRIEGHSTFFYGLCRDCMQMEKDGKEIQEKRK